jgi:hypothetical protein
MGDITVGDGTGGEWLVINDKLLYDDWPSSNIRRGLVIIELGCHLLHSNNVTL